MTETTARIVACVALVLAGCSTSKTGEGSQEPSQSGSKRDTVQQSWPLPMQLLEDEALVTNVCPEGVTPQSLSTSEGPGVAFGSRAHPTSEGALEAFRCEDGKFSWTATVEDSRGLQGPQVGPSGDMYLLGTSALWGATEGGERVWTYELPEATFYAYLSPAKRGAFLLVMPKKGRHQLIKLDKGGKEEWSLSPAAFGRRSSAAGMLANPSGGVFVATGDRIFYVDSAGTVQWDLAPPGSMIGAGPDGSLYTTLSRAGLHTLVKTAPDGTVAWETEMSGEHSRTVDPFSRVTWHGDSGGVALAVASDDTVYLVGRYGNYTRTAKKAGPRHEGIGVLALNSSDGSLRWGRQFRLEPEWPGDKGVNFVPLEAVLVAPDVLAIRAQESRGYPTRGTYGRDDISYRDLIFQIGGPGD